jgi:hypothetical protein
MERSVENLGDPGGSCAREEQVSLSDQKEDG